MSIVIVVANVVVNVENVLDLQWFPSNLHIHPLCEVTPHPSIPGSTRWLCMEAQMLLMKEKYKCNFGN